MPGREAFDPRADGTSEHALAVAIVGAGPRGIGILERLLTHTPALLANRKIVIHLIDPYPAGPGRIWRSAQSALLRMNSLAQDVTMSGADPDPSGSAGLPQAGLGLLDWALHLRRAGLPGDLEPSLADELTGLAAGDFATRRLQSAYLSWYLGQMVDGMPATVRLRTHTAAAVDLASAPDGEQLIRLDGASDPLHVDAVVLALGHLEAEPDHHEQRTLDFARSSGLTYIPPGYTADLDLSEVQPGEAVLLRGFGLAFIDLMVLLTEERGGRFSPGDSGELVYHPSGAEPRLYAGSRRGVPYLTKPRYRLQGKPASLPRFFGPDEIQQLAARTQPADFRADVWPMMAKEIGWGYYTELLTGHSGKARMSYDHFAEQYAAAAWGSSEARDLIEKAVPCPGDRLDLLAADRPMAGLRCQDIKQFGTQLQDHVQHALDRRASPAFSPDLGAFTAVLSAGHHLGKLVISGKLTPRSQIEDVDGWWSGFCNYFTAGPPPQRVRELLALGRAGVISFLGPGMWVQADGQRGIFLAGGSAHPTMVSARVLIDARLPSPSVRRTVNPLLRALLRRGEIAEEILASEDGQVSSGRLRTRPADHRLVDATGHAHPRRFALGPHTSVRSPGPFIRRPARGTAFQENDAVAREILATLGAAEPRPAEPLTPEQAAAQLSVG